MQLDIHSLVKKHQKIIPIALFGFSTLLAVVMLWKIVNFLHVSIWARDVVGKAVVQIGAQTPNVEQYLTIDRSIVSTLNQNNVFVPQATPVNPISEVRAIFGDSALINNNWYKAGDSVGQAKIVAVEPTQAQIEWNGDVKTYLPVDATVIQTQQSTGRGTTRSGTQASRTAVNLSAASQNIGATASSAGGGARIDSSTSSRSARFGFQQGDVVLSINGMKVSSGDALTEVMNNIETGSAVTAQIIRNGVQMTIGRDTVSNVGGTGSNRGGRGGTQTGRATGGRGN